MIPQNNDGLALGFKFEELPTRTFYLRPSKEVISGFTDGLQAMAQAIYFILNTERYEHLIYSWNYGVELCDLFGKAIPFCLPEIERRITEALMQDTRITGVDEFTFDHSRGKIRTAFLVHTIYGNIEAQRTVEV